MNESNFEVSAESSVSDAIEREDPNQRANGHNVLVVKVRYPGAPIPFVDPHASRAETVAALQKRVMHEFEVKDIQNPDGTTTVYSLYHENVKLEDPSETLGEIAGERQELDLKLVQFVHQG